MYGIKINPSFSHFQKDIRIYFNTLYIFCNKKLLKLELSYYYYLYVHIYYITVIKYINIFELQIDEKVGCKGEKQCKKIIKYD